MRRDYLIPLALVLLVSAALAAPPSWWSDASNPVLDPNQPGSITQNYAPANLGQLKNLAKKAKTHLDLSLPGGSGPEIEALINSFGGNLTAAQRTANYAPVNLGQLKAVAKPFYDRLQAFSYDTKANLIEHGYPASWNYIYSWDPTTPVSENYVPANIGQLKATFSFDLSAPAGQLPNWWQSYYFNGQTNISPSEDPDGDGLTNLQEYQQGRAPGDYYNGNLPTLAIISGSGQTGETGEVLPLPLVVEVRNGQGLLLANAPVEFSTTAGQAEFGSTQQSANATALTSRTDSNGRAVAYVRPQSAGGSSIAVSAAARSGNQTASVAFTASIVNPVLVIKGGNNQAGVPGTYLAEPFQIEVRYGSATGALLANRTVNFAIASGTGGLATVRGNANVVSNLQVTTGSNGTAGVWLRLGETAKSVTTITASVGTFANATFQSRTSEASGLWSEWKFNEQLGTTANETTGLAPAGTLMNGATWNTGYNTQGGLKLNGFTSQGGSNSYVTMGNPSDRSLDFGRGSFSISLWVKFSRTDIPPGHYGRRIVTKGHHGWNSGYFIGLHGTGRIEAGIGSTTSSTSESTLIKTTNHYNDDQWHHVAFVNDRESGISRIYVDGVAQPLIKDTGTGGTISANDPTAFDISALQNLDATRDNQPLCIGSHGGSYDYFDGGIDEIRIYRKALNSSEVAALRNADYDNDSLPDWWEMQQFGSIGQGAMADPDGDELTNIEELQFNTNPANPDSDNDGLLDGYENLNGLNPLLADAFADKDNDGVPNREDARPNNSSIGRLTITITSPQNNGLVP